MNENQTTLDWRFWRQWVPYSTLGYTGGFWGWCVVLTLLMFLSGESQFYSPLAMAAAMAFGGATAGAVVGLMQWEAVRLKVPHTNKKPWMAVNILSMAISWAILFGILEIVTERLKQEGIWLDIPTDYTLWSVIAAAGLWGILSAANLWRILYGQIEHVALWFTWNSLCGILVFAIGWIWVWIPYTPTGFVYEYTVLEALGPSMLSAVLWLIAGLLYGLMTGTLLAWLLRDAKQPVGSDEHVLAG